MRFAGCQCLGGFEGSLLGLRHPSAARFRSAAHRRRICLSHGACVAIGGILAAQKWSGGLGFQARPERRAPADSIRSCGGRLRPWLTSGMGTEVPHTGRLALSWDRQAQRWLLCDEELGLRLHLPETPADWELSFGEDGMATLCDGQRRLSCSEVLPVALVRLDSDPKAMHVLGRDGSTTSLARYRWEHTHPSTSRSRAPGAGRHR